MTDKPSDRAGKFGFLGNCDLPKITVDSFFDYILHNVTSDFMLYLGDNPAHNMWEQEKKTHLDGLRYISKRLIDDYKRIVYPVLGNHEGLPCDNFDFETGETNWIVNESLSLWKEWLTPSSVATFKSAMVYSQLHPGTKLRIIGLNPFVHLTVNKYLWGNQTDPAGVVRSHQELVASVAGARAAAERVEPGGRADYRTCAAPQRSRESP